MHDDLFFCAIGVTNNVKIREEHKTAIGKMQRIYSSSGIMHTCTIASFDIYDLRIYTVERGNKTIAIPVKILVQTSHTRRFDVLKKVQCKFYA